MEPCNSPWGDAERRLLDGILDQIIPSGRQGAVPAAGALGIARFVGDRVAADPHLAALFERGLATAAELGSRAGGGFEALGADARRTVVAQLERHEPEFFAALLRHAYMGYYSRPDVRALFGLSAEPTQPGGYDVPDDDPDELARLLEPVTRRGPCYRPC